MALPTTDNLCTLDYLYLGGPFVQMATKSTTDLGTLDVVDLGAPFWAISPAAGGATYDGKLYIYQSGNWVPRPLLVADPFDRRPVWFYADGEWHLTQSF